MALLRDPLGYLNLEFPRRRLSTAGEKLRILIVSAYLPHLGRHGGAGRVFQLLQRVAQRHQVTVAAFVESPQEAAEVGQLEPFCHAVITVERKGFVPLSPFPYEPFEEFNCPPMREALNQLLLEEDFDLVHFEWTQMALYVDLFPDLPKLITEIEVNYAAHWSLVPLERNWLRKLTKYYNTLQTLYRELESCRRVDRVVCVTDADRGFLRGYLPQEKLLVVNTGVDTSYFHPEEDRVEPDSLVYVGAFRHHPNVDAMQFFCSQVFPRILDQRPQTKLYIVGSSPPPEIRRLGQNPAIQVTGFVEDIREYYWRAQVVIVPLRTGVGIRGKILEGWAAAKAMVATSLACLGIRAQHGHNIIVADEPDEFALWTLALLRHPEHCRRLGQAGRQTALEFYEWDELGRQMSSIYESLVPRRKLAAPTPASALERVRT